MKKKWIIFIVILSFTYTSSSEELGPNYFPEITDIGLSANLFMVKHTASFSKFPGIPSCCPLYSDVIGNGFNLGIYANSFFNENIGVSISLNFIGISGDFATYEKTMFVNNGFPIEGEIKHVLDTKILYFSPHFDFVANIFGGFQFKSGFSLSLPLYGDFYQIEQITKPEFGVFIDSNGQNSGKRSRNEFSGEIPGLNSILIHYHIGASYKIPIHYEETLFIIPHVNYYHPLNKVLDYDNWSVQYLSAGISLELNLNN